MNITFKFLYETNQSIEMISNLNLIYKYYLINFAEHSNELS